MKFSVARDQLASADAGRIKIRPVGRSFSGFSKDENAVYCAQTSASSRLKRNDFPSSDSLIIGSNA
jgi:hypothetical protein